MKIGAVNNFKNDICDEIRLIASEGFDFVDLTLEPHFSDKLDLNRVISAIKETSIDVIGHTSAFLPIIFPLKSIRSAAYEEIEKYVDFFGDLGVNIMNVHPSTDACLMSDKDMIRNNRNVIDQLSQKCRLRGIQLMVETVLKPFNTPEVFEKILMDLDEVKIHLDVGHCNVNTDRDLVSEFFEKFGERIVHVHFSDNFGERDEHLPLGCGNIDWENVIKILRANDYDGTVTLEVFTQNRNYLLESKQFIKRIIESYDKN